MSQGIAEEMEDGSMIADEVNLAPTIQEKKKLTMRYNIAASKGSQEDLKQAVDAGAAWWKPTKQEDNHGGVFHKIFRNADDEADERLAALNYLSSSDPGFFKYQPFDRSTPEEDRTPLFHSKVGLGSKDKDRSLPLHLACEHGSVSDLKWMVAVAGKDKFKDWLGEKNKGGLRPLDLAVGYDRLPIVRWLLKECCVGSDTVLQEPLASPDDRYDEDGMQPLHHACKFGRCAPSPRTLAPSPCT